MIRILGAFLASFAGVWLKLFSDKDYHGVEYYEAVIADGISNMVEFEEWITDHRKKAMYYCIP